jgi:ABC-type amino acid transport system permease subunit
MSVIITMGISHYQDLIPVVLPQAFTVTLQQEFNNSVSCHTTFLSVAFELLKHQCTFNNSTAKA